MKMFKVYILSLFALIMIGLTGCGGSVSKVKNFQLEGFNDKTIGEVFKDYKGTQKATWSEKKFNEDTLQGKEDAKNKFAAKCEVELYHDTINFRSPPFNNKMRDVADLLNNEVASGNGAKEGAKVVLVFKGETDKQNPEDISYSMHLEIRSEKNGVLILYCQNNEYDDILENMSNDKKIKFYIYEVDQI